MTPGVPTYKTMSSARFANQERLDDATLCEAVQGTRKGPIDADLGGCVIKQGIARRGGGRSSGYRTIMLSR